MTEKKSSYSAKDIYVLEGLDPVRKRPGMYIGSTGIDGLHHLVWECLDNIVDEFMGGNGNRGEITLLPNNRVRVSDNGRGIPVDKHALTKKSALETIMTTLHAGGKFGGDAYKVSGGLHGVGISVVCALSSYMKAEVKRDGFIFSQEYSKGKPTTNVKKNGPSKETGTTIIFEPDDEIFKEIKFDKKKILNHLRQQAYLTKGIRLDFFDEREKGNETSYSFYFEGGLKSYIKHLTRGINLQHQNSFYCLGEKNEILVEAAFHYSDEYECYEESFANNIYTPEGGTHLTGLRASLTRTLNDYARRNEILKGADDNLTGEDVREGFTGVVSIKIREPQFEGQTKAKLGNPEAKPAVDQIISENLADFLERNPQDSRAIIEKCLLSAKARKAARAAKDTVLRKGVLDGLALPGKLADCSSKKPEESEIFIVEGDSAGGCFFGETKVALVDGRSLSFRELVKEDKKGKKNFCYTIKEDGSVGVELIKYPRKTKKNTEVIKVILDNNEEIICTPDHKFMTRDGFYKMAKDLKTTDSLMPLNRKLSELGGKITIKGYEMVFDNSKRNWIFTHILSDRYNIENNVYEDMKNCDKHHRDFNKLNNNPDNIIRMPKEEHMAYHRKMIQYGIRSELSIEKSKKTHQSEEYKKRISDIMSTPEMKEMLSKRAKKQWQNEDYKRYMVNKFLDFYKNNSEYRKKNNELLNREQKKYWADKDNRKKQSERVSKYFMENPNMIEEYSKRAKRQWKNENLLNWRKEETKKQWTKDFRIKRKESYDKTYLRKALSLMKEIISIYGKIEKEEYKKERLKRDDKSILKYETICQRFFNGNEERLKESVLNYNHKIKKIVFLNEKMDVYDIEVGKTHNFALDSGIFVHNSCKSARDRRFQAILPLRGKILNVERARLDKILASKEIRALVIALGTAIGDDFNIEKLRYHKVILTLDADVDGSHIRTLLLTFFFRYFRPIIENGHLYIAQPPLYKIQTGKRIQYAYVEEQKENIIKSLKKEGIINISIQRYKGLGEMDPSQLWETTMNPENRILFRVEIDNGKEVDKIFDTLMGNEVFPRKKFIQTYAKEVKNLDI